MLFAFPSSSGSRNSLGALRMQGIQDRTDRASHPATIPSPNGAPSIMEQRISIVSLGVKDLKNSKNSYAKGFGWKPVFENQETLFYLTGGMIFALFLRNALAANFNADPATFGRAPMALAYNVRAKAEVDPAIRRAVSAGATLPKPAREASWGAYSGYFADPDGFASEVACDPGWRISPDANFEFGTAA
jgi:uncharacterized protein